MAANRRTILLGSGLVVGIVVAAVVWTSGGSGRATGPSLPPRAPAGGQAAANGAPASQNIPDVNLEALTAKRIEPVDAGRNPFRFQPRAPAPPPVTTTLPPPRPLNEGPLVPAPPPVPAGPPQPPPIPLKFIGIVTQGQIRLAVLSDGKSTPSGPEGAIILGQYRILKIGNESIEMAYVDGRGRQTIRLTGQ